MRDLQSFSDTEIHQTLRLVRDEVRRRGWQASILETKSPITWVKRSDGETLTLYGSAPPTTSFSAAAVADNKLATYAALTLDGRLRQLATSILFADDSTTITHMLEKHERIVVKPSDGAHGAGVTTNIADQETALRAIELARANTQKKAVIVQEQYAAEMTHELRVLCIDGEYIGAIYRQPARVFGDGIHSIYELIEQENTKDIRGAPYRQVYATISVERAEEHLGARITDVPKEGEQVNVLGVANYGMGGETIDVTDELPQWLIDDALYAAAYLRLPLVGVDFIMKAYPTAHSSRDELDAVVLEVNRTPSLAIHDQPTSGTPRPAVKTLFDYLARL